MIGQPNRNGWSGLIGITGQLRYNNQGLIENVENYFRKFKSMYFFKLISCHIKSFYSKKENVGLLIIYNYCEVIKCFIF